MPKEISKDNAVDEIAKDSKSVCFFLGAGAAVDESLPKVVLLRNSC